MSSTVTLTVTEGMFPGKTYVFDRRTICRVGRAGDCSVKLPNDFAHQDVSRHHCLLDIDPPLIRVRDLGSRNGTFVNGQSIGQRPRHVAAELFSAFDMPDHVLHNGDEMKLGGTIFRVTIERGQDDTGVEAVDDSCVEAVPA
jgi:pSer/pThr/pTyr-binding forkhead associated (FHA) protein